jgi:hypothetical protein
VVPSAVWAMMGEMSLIASLRSLSRQVQPVNLTL